MKMGRLNMSVLGNIEKEISPLDMITWYATETIKILIKVT